MSASENQPQFKCLSKREKIDFIIYGLGLDPKDAVILKNLHLDLEELLLLTEDDIQNLGIKDSQLRKKLFILVEKYKLSLLRKDTDDDKIENSILYHDSFNLITNNSKHLEFIQDSLDFIDKKLNINYNIPNFMLSSYHSLGDGLDILNKCNRNQMQNLIDNLKILQEKCPIDVDIKPKRKKSKRAIYICLYCLLSSSIILGICTWKISK